MRSARLLEERKDIRPARGAARGFTLVELMVVIGIMAILMAIALPSGLAMRRQNRRATCASNLKAIGQALLMFREDYRCFPPDSTEYLWTKESYDKFLADNPTVPASALSTYDPTSLVNPAYRTDTGESIPTYATNPDTGDEIPVHGLGLYTLYYVGLYSSVLPPAKSDPRFHWQQLVFAGLAENQAQAASIKGFNDPKLEWFKGAKYLGKLQSFHCPENDAEFDKRELKDRTSLPGLTRLITVRKWNKQTKKWDTFEDQPDFTHTSYWNNYDQFYRRNYWSGWQTKLWGEPDVPAMHPSADGAPAREELMPDGTTATFPAQGQRSLWNAYPPADTVVTWCANHHRGYKPRWPGDAGRPDLYDEDKVNVGSDIDLVLFADGTVRRLPARQDGRAFEAPTSDSSWPGGPVM